MDDVLTLIAPTLAQNDIGDFVEQSEKSREIFGTVSSVSRAEWYNAGREGMNPEIVFTTALANYCWEPEAEFRGVRYAIYRTYFVQDTDEIELYLERKAGVS